MDQEKDEDQDDEDSLEEEDADGNHDTCHVLVKSNNQVLQNMDRVNTWLVVIS